MTEFIEVKKVNCELNSELQRMRDDYKKISNSVNPLWKPHEVPESQMPCPVDSDGEPDSRALRYIASSDPKKEEE